MDIIDDKYTKKGTWIKDGVLMCNKDCCGAPVSECSCDSSCKKCNCYNLKEEGVFEPDMLSEATEVGKLCSLRMNGGDYHLRRQIKQNFDEDGEIKIYPEKTKITDVKESCIGYGVLIYEGRIDEDKVLFTAEDVY